MFRTNFRHNNLAGAITLCFLNAELAASASIVRRIHYARAKHNRRSLGCIATRTNTGLVPPSNGSRFSLRRWRFVQFVYASPERLKRVRPNRLSGDDRIDGFLAQIGLSH